jgi:hypothetical protein
MYGDEDERAAIEAELAATAVELAGIVVDDQVVDRIYDAAHIAGGVATHQVWARKAYIGQMVQAVTAWGRAGMSRASAREKLRAIDADMPIAGGRASAEAHRMTALIYDEVYGTGGRHGGE